MRPLRLTDLKASRTPRKPEDLATRLAAQLYLASITGYLREYQFHPARKWRLDLAWPDRKLAVECEGFAARGQAGRHQLTQHMHGNCEKHSALAVAGWRLLRVTGLQIDGGFALRWIIAALDETPGAVFDRVEKWDLDMLRQVRGHSRRRRSP